MGIIAKLLHIDPPMKIAGSLETTLLGRDSMVEGGPRGTLTILMEEKTYPTLIKWFKNWDKRVMFPIFRKEDSIPVIG